MRRPEDLQGAQWRADSRVRDAHELSRRYHIVNLEHPQLPLAQPFSHRAGRVYASCELCSSVLTGRVCTVRSSAGRIRRSGSPRTIDVQVSLDSRSIRIGSRSI